MYDPERHHRRSIRLRHYDYSQPGLYYVTIVVQQRQCLFGAIVGARMAANEAGKTVGDMWQRLPERFPSVELDQFIIMPNHLHGIIRITDRVVGATLVVAPGQQNGRATAQGGHQAGGHKARPYLGDIVGAFKSLTTCAYVEGIKQRGWLPFHAGLWQRNYYEHVVRNEDELAHIRDYIRGNPLNWALDCENPASLSAQAEEPWRQ